jgi:hypothetical protein
MCSIFYFLSFACPKENRFEQGTVRKKTLSYPDLVAPIGTDPST